MSSLAQDSAAISLAVLPAHGGSGTSAVAASVSRPSTTSLPTVLLPGLQTQTANSHASAPALVNPSPGQVQQPVADGTLSVQPRNTTLTPHRRLWDSLLSTPNSTGFMAIILALVFGIGAWAGMNMQIRQAAQNLELTVWATCADHEKIQNSSLCQNVLSKSFDQFQKRDERAAIVDIEDLTKGVNVAVGFTTTQQSTIRVHNLSPMEAFFASLSMDKRTLIPGRETSYRNLPESGVTVFPLVEFLCFPLCIVFSCLEALLLATIPSIHTHVRWIRLAARLFFQTILYSLVKDFPSIILLALGKLLLKPLPTGTPSTLFSRPITSIWDICTTWRHHMLLKLFVFHISAIQIILVANRKSKSILA